MGEKLKILAVGAHPDDVELLCSGTLARLAPFGHEIAILSLTAGELGSIDKGREESIRNRINEAELSASVIGGKFYYAGIQDKHVFFSAQERNRVTEIFRIIDPDIVFAPSPKDYILDHEFSSVLTRDAATAASARLFETGVYNPVPPTEKIPHLYYCDPIGRVDVFGNPVLSTTYVDIEETLETKLQMFNCFVSQIEFLRHRHKVEYLEVVRQWAVDAGRAGGFCFAEGFRQHLAPPFPKDNILVQLLGARLMKEHEQLDC